MTPPARLGQLYTLEEFRNIKMPEQQLIMNKNKEGYLNDPTAEKKYPVKVNIGELAPEWEYYRKEALYVYSAQDLKTWLNTYRPNYETDHNDSPGTRQQVYGVQFLTQEEINQQEAILQTMDQKTPDQILQEMLDEIQKINLTISKSSSNIVINTLKSRKKELIEELKKRNNKEFLKIYSSDDSDDDSDDDSSDDSGDDSDDEDWTQMSLLNEAQNIAWGFDIQEEYKTLISTHRTSEEKKKERWDEYHYQTTYTDMTLFHASFEKDPPDTFDSSGERVFFSTDSGFMSELMEDEDWIEKEYKVSSLRLIQLEDGYWRENAELDLGVSFDEHIFPNVDGFICKRLQDQRGERMDTWSAAISEVCIYPHALPKVMAKTINLRF